MQQKPGEDKPKYRYREYLKKSGEYGVYIHLSHPVSNREIIPRKVTPKINITKNITIIEDKKALKSIILFYGLS